MKCAVALLVALAIVGAAKSFTTITVVKVTPEMTIYKRVHPSDADATKKMTQVGASWTRQALENINSTGVWEHIYEYQLALSNANVTGLEDYVVSSNETNSETGQTTVILTYDSLTITGQYWTNGTLISLLPVFGSGAFTVNGLNVTVTAVRTGTTGPYDTNFFVRDFPIELEGFLGGGAMAALAQTLKLEPLLGCQIFNKFVPNLGELLNDILLGSTRTVSTSDQMHEKQATEDAFNFLMEDAQKAVMEKYPVKTAVKKHSSPQSKGEPGNANAYLDLVMELVREEIIKRNLDPYQLVDIQILLFTFTGSISGISTIHRSGDATIDYNNGTTTLTATLGVYNAKGEFDFYFTFLGLTYHGSVSATVDIIDMYLDASAVVLSPDPTQNPVTLNTFEITNFGHIDITVDVLPIFDAFVEMFAQFFANLFQGLISDILENIIRGVINDVLNSLGLPNEGTAPLPQFPHMEKLPIVKTAPVRSFLRP